MLSPWGSVRMSAVVPRRIFISCDPNAHYGPCTGYGFYRGMAKSLRIMADVAVPYSRAD